ncbi:hypothetical protein GLYMA_13G282950v4 [Glycine max]|nr:hypothetical protein GLYMA_13G282950v4 [Glycine max]KAH1103823.1 hypothetical protein GYH30_037642 [Glycine max]
MLFFILFVVCAFGSFRKVCDNLFFYYEKKL